MLDFVRNCEKSSRTAVVVLVVRAGLLIIIIIIIIHINQAVKATLEKDWTLFLWPCWSQLRDFGVVQI